MSERIENSKLKYQLSCNLDSLNVIFEDRFGLKFLSSIDIKQFFSQNTLKKYKMTKVQNKLYFVLKQEPRAQISGDAHADLIAQIKNKLQIDYVFFKALRNQSHLKRNRQFKEVCQKQVFRKLYPYIIGTIFISSSSSSGQRSYMINQTQNSVSETFKKGQLIIYVQSSKKQNIKKFIKYSQSYTKQKVIFQLDWYFGLRNIQTSDFSPEQFRCIISKLINFLSQELAQMGLDCELNILSMDVYPSLQRRLKYPDFQNKLGIQFQVQGMFQCLPQFYFNLLYIFKQHPITIGRIEDVQFPGSFTQTQQGWREKNLNIFFGSRSAVAVIRLNQNFAQWRQLKKQLKKKCFIISALKDFTPDQITTLIRQHKQLSIYLSEDNYNDPVDYQYKAVDERSFLIYCQKGIVNRFIKKALDYLDKNTKIQTPRTQFASQFQIYLFMKLVRNQIQCKYHTVSFSVKDGVLYSLCKQSDSSDLTDEMQNQKRKIIKKMVKIPTIRHIRKGQKYEICQDERANEQFCKQNNLKTLYLKFNKKIKVFMRPVNSIRSSHALAICLIDRNYKHCNFFMQNFSLNSLSTDRYQKYGIKDKKEDRIISYSMKKSKYISQMLVWYIQADKKGLLDTRKLRRDIEDFVMQFKTERTFKFMIPDYFNNQFGIFFIQLFEQIRYRPQTKVQEITIFYETQDIPRLVEAVKCFFVGRNQEYFSLQTKLHLGAEQIQKIILIQHYSARFWSQDQSKHLSPLNSFIFNYEKGKKYEKLKVPLFLKPAQSFDFQYLLHFKQEAYFKVDRKCRIQKFPVSKNKMLQQFYRVIRMFFTNSQYMTVYMNKQQTEIQGKHLYFWQKSKDVQPTSQKIKRIQINSQQKIFSKKERQIDICVKRTDIIPKYVVQTHEQFVNQVKKIIFQDD